MRSGSKSFAYIEYEDRIAPRGSGNKICTFSSFNGDFVQKCHTHDRTQELAVLFQKTSLAAICTSLGEAALTTCPNSLLSVMFPLIA
jgi:hypothetical protein